jgi:hypothetical protein
MKSAQSVRKRIPTIAPVVQIPQNLRFKIALGHLSTYCAVMHQQAVLAVDWKSSLIDRASGELRMSCDLVDGEVIVWYPFRVQSRLSHS